MRSVIRVHFLSVFLATMLVGCSNPSTESDAGSPVEAVRVVQDDAGMRLTVDGEDFFVTGMNWDYFPIGTNYEYSLWRQPDDIIEEALHREMTMLQDMGINAIRQYVGVPPRWVAYIHEKYGIYTVLNHSLGRYGVSVDGSWIPNTDYSDPASREVIMDEVLAMVSEFMDTPGVLMWLLGNENNYGLVWSSAATENLPEEERDYAAATPLYTLIGEVAAGIKEIDTLRPVAIANGDLGYMDLIIEHAQEIDIFGTNVYRGVGFTDMFERSLEEFGKPIFLTEFGADAYNAKEGREDQLNQARFMLNQWKEVTENAAGMDGTGHSLGGLTFQWSDGWWKYGQEEGLSDHDTNASWHNEGYPYDYVAGENNMNEEWFGVMAKGPTDDRQQFELIPRAAYYALKQAHAFNPYSADATQEDLDRHFAAISLEDAMQRVEATSGQD